MSVFQQFHFFIFFYLSIKDEILKQIHECTKVVKKSSVEQAATMCAWSVQNNLNVSKFREQVEKEISEDKEN